MKTLKSFLICLFAFIGISSLSVAQPAFIVSSIGNGYVDGVGDIYSFNASTFLSIGTQGCIFKTTNSGASFFKIECPTTLALNCMSFRNPNTGYIGGDNGLVLKTTDGGSLWSVLTLGISSWPIFGITLRNDEINASGGLGVILKSTNNGVNWIDQSLGLWSNFYGGTAFIPNGKKLQVSYNSESALWTSTNGGTNWVGSSLPSSGQARGQYWIDSLNGYIIGTLPASTTQVVYKTINGGANWDMLTIPAQTYLIDVSFCNANTGFIIGSTNNPSKLGQIFWTTNAGASWIKIKDYPGIQLSSVACFGSRVYIGAYGGKIFSADISVSINPISTVVPEKYSLSQNFPNPFNPTTKIRFAIPKNTNGSLIIYNMQGKEVAVIANQNFTAGTYEPYFNASGLSSGTYFYRLETEGFSQTKKMILVK